MKNPTCHPTPQIYGYCKTHRMGKVIFQNLPDTEMVRVNDRRESDLLRHHLQSVNFFILSLSGIS